MVYFSLQISDHTPSLRVVKAETQSRSWSWTLGEHYSLTCSSWLAQSAFLYNLGLLAQWWHGRTTSTSSSNKIPYRPIKKSHFLNQDSSFLDLSRCVTLTEKQTRTMCVSNNLVKLPWLLLMLLLGIELRSSCLHGTDCSFNALSSKRSSGPWSSIIAIPESVMETHQTDFFAR